MTRLTNRYDIVLFFDVRNGNPNGDPDAGNYPRIDPETNQGLVSDVALKRKLRNYVDTVYGHEPGYRIYVKEGALLNELHREAYKAVRGDTVKVEREKNLTPDSGELKALRRFMCDNFFDVRTFGAVMSTGINAGQVRGPVQMTFATSVEPIAPIDVTISRTARMNAATSARNSDETPEQLGGRIAGRKYIVPYGLYRSHVFVSGHLADQTGFSIRDVERLFEGFRGMFDHDRSAARGEMATRKLIIFKHNSALGSAAAQDLFELVSVKRNVREDLYQLDDVQLQTLPPARSFSDYLISIDRGGVPPGVEVTIY